MKPLVSSTRVMLQKQLQTIHYRCNYILFFAGILINFQGLSQSQDSLLNRIRSAPPNLHDSIYFELFKMNYKTDIVNAKHYAQKAFELSRKYRHFSMQINSCRGLGYFYDVTNKLDSSSFYYYQALKVSITNNVKGRLMDIYNDLGLLYMRQDVYDSALHYFILSYELAGDTQAHKMQAIASQNIGLVYSYLDNYDDALVYFRQAVEIKEGNNITAGLNLNLLNIARTLNEKGLHDKAIEQLNKVIANCKSGCDNTTLADLYLGLGYANFRNGEIDVAFSFFEKSFALSKNTDNKQTLANTLYNFSLIAYNKASYSEAIDYLKEAEKIAKEINHKRLLRDIYNHFSIVYNKRKSLEKSLQYQKLHIQLKDSIFNKVVANHIEGIRLDAQRKQSDSVIQKKDTELWNFHLVTILLTINCILAFAVIYFVYRSFSEGKRSRKRMENEIIKMLDARDRNQKELFRSNMEFSYLLSRVNGFLLSPVATLLGLSNLSQNVQTLEEAKVYLSKINHICKREIMGVFDKVTELDVIHNQDVVIEEFSMDKVAVLINNKFKKADSFSLLTLSSLKSVSHVVKSDLGLLVDSIVNAINYFKRYDYPNPLEVVFDQKDESTIISVKYYSTDDSVTQENLFNLFVAQVSAGKLNGNTSLTEHDDSVVLKIFIPTVYTMTENKLAVKIKEWT